MTTTADQQAATYPTAIAFCMTSALWFAGATSFGMIAAGYLIAPDFLANVGWLHFGKARPIHVNLVLFGFVTPGFLAASFYFIPKLLRTELYSETLGIFTAILWNITLISAVIGIGAGYSQGREYAELPWAVDIMVVILFVLVIINPLIWTTGWFYLFYNSWRDWGVDWLNIEYVAFFHVVAAFMMLIFFIVHVYLATAGHTPTAHIKAMISGWEEIED